MADEREPAPASGALDGLVEDLGFSPFSDTEVKCETCGMNILREREAMTKHHDFHAAAEASAPEPGTP